MKNKSKVAVCSRSFSKSEILRKELLSKYKNVKFNNEGIKFVGDSLVEFIADSEKIIVGLEIIDRKVLDCCKNIKLISKFGVGTDSLDLKLLEKRGIRVSVTPGTNSRSVSELVIALVISIYRDLKILNNDVSNGKWYQNKGRLITEKTIGIIGCNNIGKDLIKLLKPFNCKILVHDIKEDKVFNANNNIKFTSIEELLMQSDIITIHLPLNHSTNNIIDSKRLDLLKSDSVLINTSRGGLVDEIKLKELLVKKRILGAAFDVFNQEPPTDSELINLNNFFATPHIGGSTEEAILNMGRAAINGLE